MHWDPSCVLVIAAVAGCSSPPPPASPPSPVAQGDELVAANRRDLGTFVTKIDEVLGNARSVPAEFVTKPSGPNPPDLIKAQPVLDETYDQASNRYA